MPIGDSSQQEEYQQAESSSGTQVKYVPANASPSPEVQYEPKTTSITPQVKYEVWGHSSLLENQGVDLSNATTLIIKYAFFLRKKE